MIGLVGAVAVTHFETRLFLTKNGFLAGYAATTATASITIGQQQMSLFYSMTKICFHKAIR
ncbi:hypothetical protein WA1_41700 [Scytonema hofmannii PCC 7110]|uniref:Uncharacterized protein n=1 Tax=Scytonema hofmannii PCC 7110 TaxID=128403 RepID=A0A139WV07_9CYAN|nr:hypothetical protein WA1_41700 [Scytonema hofmannii PCC 7110]